MGASPGESELVRRGEAVVLLGRRGCADSGRQSMEPRKARRKPLRVMISRNKSYLVNYRNKLQKLNFL